MYDERKIPDKVKISFVNTFLFERILFIISVSKYTYIAKINCAQYGYESYAQKSWNSSFLITYHILEILCRDSITTLRWWYDMVIHSIWIDLSNEKVQQCWNILYISTTTLKAYANRQFTIVLQRNIKCYRAISIPEK